MMVQPIPSTGIINLRTEYSFDVVFFGLRVCGLHHCIIVALPFQRGDIEPLPVQLQSPEIHGPQDLQRR